MYMERCLLCFYGFALSSLPAFTQVAKGKNGTVADWRGDMGIAGEKPLRK